MSPPRSSAPGNDTATTSLPPATNDDGTVHETRRTQARVAVARPPTATTEADQTATAGRQPHCRSEALAALAAGAQRDAGRDRRRADRVLRTVLDVAHGQPPAGALRHHPARLQRGADHQRRDRTAAGDPHRLRGAGGDDPEVRDPAAAVAGAPPGRVWVGPRGGWGGGDCGPARVAGWLRPVGAFAGDGPGLPGRRRRGAAGDAVADPLVARVGTPRSEEHTSELQSLMRISYAVFCLKKKNNNL